MIKFTPLTCKRPVLTEAQLWGERSGFGHFTAGTHAFNSDAREQCFLWPRKVPRKGLHKKNMGQSPKMNHRVSSVLVNHYFVSRNISWCCVRTVQTATRVLTSLLHHPLCASGKWGNQSFWYSFPFSFPTYYISDSQQAQHQLCDIVPLMLHQMPLWLCSWAPEWQ